MHDATLLKKNETTSHHNLRDEIAIAANTHNQEKKYWLTKLAEPVKTSFHIPYDSTDSMVTETAAFAASSACNEKDGTVTFHITGELFSRLMALANQSDARLHMILTAILVVLLYKHTGNHDIIIGIPVYKQESTGDFINTALTLRNRIDRSMTFKELLFQVRQTIKEAVENQNYPIEILAEQLSAMTDVTDCGTFSLFDTALLLENIHDKTYLAHLKLGLIFCCLRTDQALEVRVAYNPSLFCQEKVIKIGKRFLQAAEVVNHLDLPAAQINILPEEERTELAFFSTGPIIKYPIDKTLPQLFREHAEKSPGQEAVICGMVTVNYGWLEENSNHLAGYLAANSIHAGKRVGILLDRNMPAAVAILAIWKAGAAYVPIDPDLPEKRMITLIDNAGIEMVISERKYIKTLNRLQWACKGFHTFFCLNSRDIYREEEVEKSGLMDPKLWEYIGASAADDIMGGGWIDSYTGEHFTRQVVEDFAENLYQKIKPIIHKNTRILEIGCASGIGMYRIAPLVGLYYGTDISRVIIDKNKQRIAEEGHTNILLEQLAAHEIDNISQGDFDLVIINSVIQDFHGHNYLRKVIRKAVEKLGSSGYLFIGDIMDLDLKEALIEDLVAFKRNHRNKTYKTKINWEAEQFFPRAFFEDLLIEIPAIQKVEFSDKIFTLENELTKFRYDTLIHVDKKKEILNKPTLKHKYQHDLRDMEKLGPPRPIMLAQPGDPAYVIYTSGSTGTPKGAIVEHRGMMNHMWAKIRDFQITGNSVVAQNSPLSFDISVWQMFSALAVGGKTVIYHDEAVLETGRFTAHLVEDRVTILEVVPSYLTLLLDALEIKPLSFNALTYLLVTGEAVGPGLLKRWFEKYPTVKVANVYGPTEASDDITHYLMDRSPVSERVPIGKPIPNLKIYIVDSDMNLCPIGAKGEIWVSGVGVGRGYLGDEDKTRQVFINDPFSPIGQEAETRVYKTGDIGCWLPDGNIDFFGRIDQQVKIRGFRIELGEIENKLAKFPEVKEVIVIDGNIEKDRRYLCAYVVPDLSVVSAEFDVYELKDYLLRQLPEYMIPQFFVKMEKLPLTANGKIDRKKLPAHDTKVRESYEAPSDETEEKLLKIISEVLEINRDTIGVHDNFFDLGANSIIILSLQHLICKTFNYDISISLLFLYPTIRGVAKNIREEEYLNKLECVIKLNEGRNEKNIFMIHPMHGMVYQYKDVAALLKDHYNVYGIQIRGFLTESKLPESVDEMVTDYLRQIKVIQKEGPYIFAGYCFGCVVGYEMIKRLEMAGETVELFIVLDEPAFIPPEKIASLKQSEKIKPSAQISKGTFGGLELERNLRQDEFTPEIAREVRQLENTILNQEKIPDTLVNQLQEKRTIIEQHLRKVEQKVSGIIGTNMYVIKARQNDRPGFELELYRKLTNGHVSLEVTEGDHNSMFYPPNVKRLAEIIIKIV